VTPISSPRFSKQNTCAMPGMAASAADRSAHASSTVRTRRGGRSANDPSCSAVKHTTSHRPKAGRAVLISPSWPGLAAAQPTAGARDPFCPPGAASPGAVAPYSEGNLFSNTTTS
jgi:hypothetical protein